MKLDLETPVKAYQANLAALVREKRANAQMLLREEARLLVRDILAFTAPIANASSGDGPRATGAKAIAHDLAKVYTTAAAMIKKASEMGARGLAVALRSAVRDGNYAEFGRLLAGTASTAPVAVKGYTRNGRTVSGYSTNRTTRTPKIPGWGGGAVNNIVDPAYHLRRRRANGRVGGEVWSQIVFEAKSYRDYVKHVQSRVGWARAGWAAAARLVGLSQPAWVTRHNAPGNALETGAPSFSIAVSNRSVAIPNYQQRVVNPALRRRYLSLAKEAERILSGGQTRRRSFAGTPSNPARVN